MKNRDVNEKNFAGLGDDKVYFCCKNCVAKYKANPEKYVTAAKNQLAAISKATKTAKQDKQLTKNAVDLDNFGAQLKAAVAQRKNERARSLGQIQSNGREH